VKKTIYQYYAYTFFRNLSFYSAVLIPFFTIWGHISLGQTELLQSWSMLWFFLLEIPTGVVADYFGRKYALAIGSFVVALTVILYGSFATYQIFLMCEFLFAISLSLTSGTDEALIYDALKEFGQEKRSREIFGHASFFRLGGVLVASLVGGLIANKFGLDVAMKAAAIPFFISALIAWTIREPKLRTIKKKESYAEIITKGWKFFSSHRVTRLLALDSIIVAAAAYFVVWLYQPLLQRFNIPIVYFGFFNAGLMSVQMIVSYNFSFLEKFFGSSKKLIQFSALVTAFSFFLVGLYPTVVTLILFLIFAGGFGLTRATFMSAYLNQYIPSEQRATILSFISLFRRLFLALIIPIVSFTVDRSLQWTLFFIGMLPILVFFFSPVEKEMFETN
jgi:MFS family permease